LLLWLTAAATVAVVTAVAVAALMVVLASYVGVVVGCEVWCCCGGCYSFDTSPKIWTHLLDFISFSL